MQNTILRRDENITQVYLRDKGLAGGHTRQLIECFNELTPGFTRAQGPRIIDYHERKIREVFVNDSSLVYEPINGPCSVEILFNTLEKKIEMQFFEPSEKDTMMSAENRIVITSDDFPSNFTWDSWHPSIDPEDSKGVAESLIRQGLSDNMIPGAQHNEIAKLAYDAMNVLYYMRFLEQDLNPKVGYSPAKPQYYKVM